MFLECNNNIQEFITMNLDPRSQDEIKSEHGIVMSHSKFESFFQMKVISE
jgi:hypothetical protein